MTRKTGTPDELAKIWGELNAYRVLLYDVYRIAIRDSDNPDEIDDIKARTHECLEHVEFPPQHEDMRAAAKVSLNQFFHDFEGWLKEHGK